MTALVVALRFVVFALMVIGLIAQMSIERGQGTALIAPLAKAAIIIAAVAYLDVWFPKLDETFLTVAEYVNPGYSNNPTLASDTVRESITANPEGESWSWRRINESIYQAITNAIAAVFIFIGTLLTVPMLIVQYILKWLLYMLTPFALAMFMLPGLSSIGTRFFQQMLAVHAWPVGFALTNLVSLAIWNDFRAAVGANPANAAEVLYSPLLDMMGGLLAAIVIIVGMISTPIVMQKLFVQGTPFSGMAGNPASIFNAGSAVVRGVAAPKTGGALTAVGRATSGGSPAILPPPAVTARPGI